MKRAGNLWPQLVSWDNLLESALAAARGKRKRPDVAKFLYHLEPNVCQLKRELEDGSYEPAPYRTFWIRDPKPRMISAATFRDRVVHHALTRVLEPVFEPRFLPCSFASRKGYGQHKALKKAGAACNWYRCVLKCDIRKYFPSIDHEILKAAIARFVKCPRTLELAAQIIDGSNEQEERNVYFPGDTLFTPYERRRGLPIGNQTSQFFANVYLNGFDHFVMRDLQPALYLRYVDDFVLFGDDKSALSEMRAAVSERLGALRLQLNEGKSRVYRCGDGIRFLGWRFTPGCVRLPRAKVVSLRRRIIAVREGFHRGALDFKGVRRRISAWRGHVEFGHTWDLQRRLFRSFILVAAERGRNSARGFVEQQSTKHPSLEP